MDRCVAEKDTAEVKWDVRYDFGEVCPLTSRSDDMETEKSQLRDRIRIGIDWTRTSTL